MFTHLESVGETRGHVSQLGATRHVKPFVLTLETSVSLERHTEVEKGLFEDFDPSRVGRVDMFIPLTRATDRGKQSRDFYKQGKPPSAIVRSETGNRKPEIPVIVFISEGRLKETTLENS